MVNIIVASVFYWMIKESILIITIIKTIVNKINTFKSKHESNESNSPRFKDYM